MILLKVVYRRLPTHFHLHSSERVDGYFSCCSSSSSSFSSRTREESTVRHSSLTVRVSQSPYARKCQCFPLAEDYCFLFSSILLVSFFLFVCLFCLLVTLSFLATVRTLPKPLAGPWSRAGFLRHRQDWWDAIGMKLNWNCPACSMGGGNGIAQPVCVCVCVTVFLQRHSQTGRKSRKCKQTAHCHQRTCTIFSRAHNRVNGIDCGFFPPHTHTYARCFTVRRWVYLLKLTLRWMGWLQLTLGVIGTIVTHCGWVAERVVWALPHNTHTIR